MQQNIRPNLVEAPLGKSTHQRHSPVTRSLAFGALNVRSLNNRVDVITDLLKDTTTDVLCLTETCHEDSDAVPIQRLRASGWQVFERARPIPSGTKADDIQFVNHGGVAIVAPTGVKLEKLKTVSDPVTFEHVFTKLTVKHCVSLS